MKAQISSEIQAKLKMPNLHKDVQIWHATILREQVCDVNRLFCSEAVDV